MSKPILSAAELHAMSPAERRDSFEASLKDSVEELEPEFADRVRDRIQKIAAQSSHR